MRPETPSLRSSPCRPLAPGRSFSDSAGSARRVSGALFPTVVVLCAHSYSRLSSGDPLFPPKPLLAGVRRVMVPTQFTLSADTPRAAR